MTIPTQHNCPHSPDGWCLECVGKLEAVRAEMLATLKLALPEIERKAFVAGCVDDVLSPELQRLRKLEQTIKAAIAKAE